MEFVSIADAIGELEANTYELAFFRNGEINSRTYGTVPPCSSCYSVAKVFVITALGMLWEEKKFDLSDMIIRYFPDETAGYHIDPAWRIVTIDYVIRHYIGFSKNFLDIDQEDIQQYPSHDFLKLIFEHEIDHRPGTVWCYTDAAYYLLSRLVEKLSGERLDDYLSTRLMKPLGIYGSAWAKCPERHTMGATGLFVSALDMVKLGAVYLNDGLYEKKRILSSDWINIVMAEEYEFMARNPFGMYIKEGMLGQGLIFNREREFAAAWRGYEPSHERSHLVLKWFLKNCNDI